jgi:hypothetical protein
MATYRVYTLSDGAHIAGPPRTISCDSDQEATEKARELVTGRDVELWQGTRCLGRFHANSMPIRKLNFAGSRLRSFISDWRNKLK